MFNLIEQLSKNLYSKGLSVFFEGPLVNQVTQRWSAFLVIAWYYGAQAMACFGFIAILANLCTQIIQIKCTSCYGLVARYLHRSLPNPITFAILITRLAPHWQQRQADLWVVSYNPILNRLLLHHLKFNSIQKCFISSILKLKA